MAKVRFIENHDELAALSPAWRELSTSVADVLPFLTQHWCDAWYRTFEERMVPRVVALFEGSRLDAVMPLMWQRVCRGPGLSVRFDYDKYDKAILNKQPRFRLFPVRQLTFPMNLESASLRGGILCRPGCEETVLLFLFAALKRQPDWDVAVLPCSRETAIQWSKALGKSDLTYFIRDGQRKFYCTEIKQPWNEYLNSRSKNFRQNYRRAEVAGKKLHTDFTSWSLSGESITTEILERFFDIGRRSWKMSGCKDVDFYLPITRKLLEFNQRVCTVTGQPDVTPVLHLVGLPQQFYAGMLCFKGGSRLLTSQTYYDANISQVSPGRWLAREAWNWSWNNNVSTIDWNGFSSYVQSYAGYCDDYFQILVFRGNCSGRLLKSLSQWAGGSTELQVSEGEG